MANLTVITDVACTVCGCVCDDLNVTVADDRIVQAEGACRLAEPWLLGQNQVAPPVARVDGEAVPLEQALDRAVTLLKSAKAPLIYGLSRSTTEGQRAATALADRLGATIDTTASTGHAPSILALQQVGESTCTLGEVRNRADFVIYWGSDPLVTHPRHLERYVPRLEERHLVVADVAETETARLADTFLRIEPGRDWEALWTLRLLLRGKEPRPGSVTGAPLDELRALAERMRSARFGIVFFGNGITRGAMAHRTVEALLQLVTDLNEFTRFYARRMRRFGDVAGADSVLAWQTGYPFGVNLGPGYPRYNPGEFTGPDLLARGEVDLAVLVGTETVADFSPAAQAHLRTIPTIVLDSPGAAPFEATVQITTAVYGVHRSGTAYRMDEVPIPLRVLVPTAYPSDGEVLSAMLERIT